MNETNANHSSSIRLIRVPKPVYEKKSKSMCGKGRIEELSSCDSPKSPHIRAMYVRFENGAYTNWHLHEGWQVLVVTKGVGFVEEDGKAPHFQIAPYDRIYIPPRLWHRHGALEGRQMVHLAVTIGHTVWKQDDPCDKFAGTRSS